MMMNSTIKRPRARLGVMRQKPTQSNSTHFVVQSETMRQKAASAHGTYERYLAMASDAKSSGDRVGAENYLQHAEHYLRVYKELQAVSHAAPVLRPKKAPEVFDDLESELMKTMGGEEYPADPFEFDIEMELQEQHK